MEQYHVLQSHPQLRIPGRMFPRPGKPFDRQAWMAGELQYLHTMSDGMAGMVHAKDVEVAEGLREIELPTDPKDGRSALAAHAERRGRGVASRLRGHHSRSERAGRARHGRLDVLRLPALLRAADVQQRLFVPLPAARPGGDADGDLVAHPLPGRQRAGRPRRSPRSGSTTIRAGHRSPPRTSPTCRASKKACTPGVLSTCGCQKQPRAASRTSSG